MSDETPPPPPPPPPPMSSYVDAPGSLPPKRRRRAAVAIGLVMVVVAGAAAFAVANRKPSAPPGPPGAPTGVSAKAQTCAPPRCRTIGSTVTITWTPPSGTLTQYQVFRNGSPLSGATKLPGSTTTFTDTGAGYGDKYTYTVTASTAAGTSPVSDGATVTPAMPPVSAAQLSGSYRVRLTVLHVENVGRVEGIKDPKPGDKKTETWTFNPVCKYNTGPCNTFVNEEKPALSFRGATYSGTVSGSTKAKCTPEPEVPVRFIYHLNVKGAQRSAGWDVLSFSGTFTVSFACGGFVSTGTFSVRSVQS
jgi:hypothetical protein